MNSRLLLVFTLSHLAALGIGGAVGFHHGPVKTVEKDRVVTVEKATTQITQKVDLEELRKLIADSARKNNVVTTRETVKAPDGTVTTKVRTEDKTETTIHTETTDATHAVTTTDIKLWKETVRVEEHLKLIETKLEARWAFEVNAGYLLPTLWNREAGFSLLPTRGLMVGASAYHRFIGPVWLGAWANSMGAAGAGLRWSF